VLTISVTYNVNLSLVSGDGLRGVRIGFLVIHKCPAYGL
jgi:hypothetical protein